MARFMPQVAQALDLKSPADSSPGPTLPFSVHGAR
jgi:hypothetical protein